MSGNFKKMARATALLPKETNGSPQLVEGLYAAVCRLEVLQQAYDAIKMDAGLFEITPSTLEGIDRDGVEKFLRQLAQELVAANSQRADKHPPWAANSSSADSAIVGYRVVQVALTGVLQRAFPGQSPCEPESGCAVKWVAAAIKRGLSRACALKIDESSAEWLLERAATRIDDADLMGLLRTMLEASPAPASVEPDVLGRVLLNIAYHGIDHVLQQAAVLVRQGSVVHATAARFGHDLILLVDKDAQFDWVIPAVRKRVAEEAAEIKVEIDAGKTQVVDLARGEKLRFLGYELRGVKASDGTIRADYKLVDPAAKPVSVEAAPGEAWRLPGSDLARSCGRWAVSQPRWQYGILGCVVLLATVLGVVYLGRAEGPRLYPVSGHVSLEGKPTTGALVVFHPTERFKQGKERPTGRVAGDGSYILGTYKEGDGAPAGEYTVTVSMLLSKTENLSPAAKKKKVANFPAKYGSWDTSPLLATVELKATEVPTFELEREKKPVPGPLGKQKGAPKKAPPP